MGNKIKTLYIKTGNDEAYTPAYGVEPILEFIPKEKIIWCPFDTEKSEFVKLIRKNGNKVEYSHKNEKDFFEYEPEEWDIIISNPPFQNKKEFFKRALSFEKPFALLMSISWLNDVAPKVLFKNKDLQLLMFDKRIRFTNPYNKDNKRPTFSSAYYCWNFLPKQIIIKEIDIQRA